MFDIEKDLETDKVLKAVRKGSTRENGEFLFDPDLWKGKSDELTIEKCKLSDDELRAYAVMATEVRQKFQEQADAIHEKRMDEEANEGVTEEVPKLRRNYSSIVKQSVTKEMLSGHEHNTASPKRKRLSLS